MSGKLVPSTNTSFLWGGVMAGYLGIGASLDAMRAASQTYRAFVIQLIPDALAANKLIMARLSIEIPRAPHLEGHCAAHALMLLWDAGMQGRLESFNNPL